MITGGPASDTITQIMTIIDYNRCHKVTLVILTRLNIRNKRDTCDDSEATQRTMNEKV